MKVPWVVLCTRYTSSCVILRRLVSSEQVKVLLQSCAGGNVTETTSSTTPEAVLPNRTSEWEKHVLYNLMIIVSLTIHTEPMGNSGTSVFSKNLFYYVSVLLIQAVVVLIIVGAVFLLRYMRAEKKLTKRR